LRCPTLRAATTAAVLALALAACGNADDGATVRNLDGTGGTTGSASGSASGSGSGSGSASASTTAQAGAAGATDTIGAYEPVSDVAPHAKVSLDVCDVNAALPGDGELDFDEAARIYAEGGNSLNGDGSARTLQGFATGERDEPLWDTAVEHFGSESYLDDFVTEALEGTGGFADATEGARRQAVTKAVQYHIPVMWAFHEIDAAAEKLAAGETDPASGAPHNVDEAWAFLHGEAPDCAPYLAGSRRGEEFGTGEAANEEALAANEAMRDAAVEGDEAAFEEAYDRFVDAVLVPYVQGALKYSQVTADDVAAGDAEAAAAHQAEGLAFWRVAAPFVAEVDPEAAAEVDAVFDVTTTPTEDAGERVAAALEDVYAELGIDAERIGEFQG
jgi:hypothetical protein